MTKNKTPAREWAIFEEVVIEDGANYPNGIVVSCDSIEHAKMHHAERMAAMMKMCECIPKTFRESTNGKPAFTIPDTLPATIETSIIVYDLLIQGMDETRNAILSLLQEWNTHYQESHERKSRDNTSTKRMGKPELEQSARNLWEDKGLQRLFMVMKAQASGFLAFINTIKEKMRDTSETPDINDFRIS